jgi:hypothetical protein
VVCSDEVTTWIADYWNIEFAESGEDVGSIAVFVGKRVAWFVDSAVDTTAHVP